VVPYSNEFAIDNLKASSKLFGELASLTGGRVLSRPYEVFNGDFDPVRTSVDISWLFITLALLTWPVDIMNRYAFKYSMRQSVQSLFRNSWLAIITSGLIAISLAILGGFLLVTINVNQFISTSISLGFFVLLLIYL